ncbi:MAG TPA: ATP-binding protein, partial [Stenotrophomonas sp.]|nr:ATP-binding protein [Stenotrophomonas sp.]
GFNNRDKLVVFEREAQELAKRIASCDTDIASLRGQRDRDNERRLACHELIGIQWNEIDVAAPQQRLADIEATLRDLREGNADLARLAKQIDAVRADIEQARRTYEDTRVERGQLVRERDRLDRARQQSRALVLPALAEDQEAGLAERLQEQGPLSLETLEAHMRQVSNALNEQLSSSQQDVNRVENLLLGCFRRFIQQWPEESGDFTVSVASAEDFLARLERLERDGLPQHEERFFDLLQNQSKNNLLALQRHSAEARKSIGQRLDEVNASLEQVPFNRGTLLTIELSDRRLPEVGEFHLQLREVLSQQQTEQRELAESQFTVLRQLVNRLG